MPKTTDFTNFANEHPNYFPGQYLLEDDFELQHKYLSDRQRYHNQILQISGIIEGLEVEAISDTKSVKIKSGTAIDGNGELIVLKNDTSFDLKKFPNGEGELYIQFSHEYKKESKQQEGVDASYTRWIEKPVIDFAATAPENSIKLLKLTISDNAITNVDLSIRIYSGVSLPNSNNSNLTLRSGGNTNPNLAVLTGSLNIDGDLTVKGTGISSFAGNLTVNGNIVLSDSGKQIQLIKAVTADGTTAWGTIQANSYVGLQIGFPDSSFGGKLQIGTLTSRGEREFNELMLIEANGNTSIRGNLTVIDADLTVSGTISGKIDAGQITSGVLAVERIPNLSADIITSGILNVDIIPNLSADKITSGVLAIERIPNLLANKITSGVLAVERIPNLSADKITSGLINGNLSLKGSLTIQEGQVNLGGNQQIVFTNTDVTNKLKLQLWEGYGLGINPGTLFYTADGNHSWRDRQSNESMLLTTGANGGLVVKGTGVSSFAGNVNIASRTLSPLPPVAKLDISDVPRTGIHPNSVKGLYVTAEFDESNGIEFRHTNGSQGIGFGYNTIYATGSYNDQNLSLKARGAGKVIISNGAIQPSAGNTENNGIMFPKDPGGGSGDAAWIRYYSRNPNSTDAALKEQTTLEIGISNDPVDYISLNPRSNPINFTGQFNATTDKANNIAEISNDIDLYKTLMIIGNTSNGQGRRVSVWDRFEVNGLFVNNSSQEHKKDITKLSDEDLNSIIDKLKQTPVFRYRFKTPGIDSKIRLGVIAEQSPEEILDESGKAVSFLDYNGFLLAAIKAQQSLIEQLQKDILLLQNV